MLNFEKIKQDFDNLLLRIISPDNLPKTIFHYTSADGLSGILSNAQLWFTRWDSLNDTSEHRYIHSLIKTCLDELNLDDSYTKYLHALNETFLSFKQDNANIQIDKNIYLASFSSNGDSVPMWTYYTKSAQNNGYCIGFDSNFLRESFNETNFSIAPVIYSENIQKEIIINFIKILYSIFEHIQNEAEHANYARACFQDYFEYFSTKIGCFFKLPEFQHEQEIRIQIRIDSKQAIEKNEIKIRTSNGLLIPYISIPIKKESITEITSSPTLEASAAYNGIRTAATLYGYSVDIKHSKLPLRNI
ncbi:MAG: DUF2971 domain-containing protein [Akkermansia sp.]|nr:DUF2971 domain-containing protein [Akkermansia sp.]